MLDLRVIALAGRRIDAESANIVRFPLDRVPQVRHALRTLIRQTSPQWLVSSAACGADLLAQELAGDLGVHRRVVLPFDQHEFRRRSVIDRPGDRGPRFDAVLRQVAEKGGIVDMALDPDAPAIYAAGNQTILDQALALADGQRNLVAAVLVWEGQSRGHDDVTAAFAEAAAQRRIRLYSVLTTATTGPS